MQLKKIDCVIEGLKILREYSNDIACEHDILYAGTVNEPPSMTDDEKKKLEEMHWLFVDGEGWSIWI